MIPFRRESDDLTRSSSGAHARHARQLDFLGMPAIIASRAMQRIIEKAEKVARTDSSVLIEGESGVGTAFKVTPTVTLTGLAEFTQQGIPGSQFNL